MITFQVMFRNSVLLGPSRLLQQGGGPSGVLLVKVLVLAPGCVGGWDTGQPCSLPRLSLSVKNGHYMITKQTHMLGS